jgi:putative membrane protein
MATTAFKNNYRNIRIVVLCFVGYILLNWFSPFLMLLNYDFVRLFITFITSVIVMIPIVIGYKLLDDKGNYLQVFGVEGNIKEGLIAGGVLFLAAWIFSIFSLDFLRNLVYVKWLLYIFIEVFVIDLCVQAFFFRKITTYTGWSFFRIILFYVAIYSAVALVTAFVSLLFNSEILSKIGDDLKLLNMIPMDLLLKGILSLLRFILTASFLYWLYVEWNSNLWVVVFAHLVLNLANGLTFLKIPIFILLIVTGVIGTILYKREKGLPLAIKRFWS